MPNLPEASIILLQLAELKTRVITAHDLLASIGDSAIFVIVLLTILPVWKTTFSFYDGHKHAVDYPFEKFTKAM